MELAFTDSRGNDVVSW